MLYYNSIWVYQHTSIASISKGIKSVSHYNFDLPLGVGGCLVVVGPIVVGFFVVVVVVGGGASQYFKFN